MAITFKGSNLSDTATVTIPSHSVGDIIIIYAHYFWPGEQPGVPSAGGTVPAWVAIDSATTNVKFYYYVATATNHTSGTWTNADTMIAVVLSGQHSSPIGGHQSRWTDAAEGDVCTSAAITLSVTDGSSAILHFFGYYWDTGWGSAPAGYTKRQPASGNHQACLLTKDTTTTDGAAAITINISPDWTQAHETLEIKAAPTAVVVQPSGASISVTGSTPTVTIPDNKLVRPTGASLSLTGSAPKIWVKILPTAVTLGLTGLAPQITAAVTVVPTPAAFNLTGSVPLTVATVTVVPVSATVTLTGSTPVIGSKIVAVATTLTLTGSQPVVESEMVASAATLTLTGSTPDVNVNVIVTGPLEPSAATLTLTGETPIVSTPVVVSAANAALHIIRYVPGILNPVRIEVFPNDVILSITEFAPTIICPVPVVPEALSVTITGHEVRVIVGQAGVATPDYVVLTLTGYAPRIDIPIAPLSPTPATLSIQASTPDIYVSVFYPVPVLLLLRGHRPEIVTPISPYPAWLFALGAIPSVTPEAKPAPVPIIVTSNRYYQRCRFIIEDTHGNILARDVVVNEPKVVRQLSGPCTISFKVHHREPTVQNADGVGPILLKPWGHWIHVEKELFDGTRAIIASGIVQPSEVDPLTGVLSLEAKGFSSYPKGLPWLENWNPIAVDPFEIFERIWNHIQSYNYGDLGVTVYPTSSGTYMLPGFSFDSEVFVQDFFAIFIREIDRLDCGDYLEGLARDIPIDYWERSEWNEDYTAINKSIQLAYPHGGIIQDGLSFRINENVSNSKQRVETEMNWVSGITFKGWFPSKEYYGEFINADPDRYRRIVDEADAKLDSNERSAAWAHRKLTRRQIPYYYESITVDPYHPNAPFGTWDVGDTINVRGLMPWHGNIEQYHRIVAYGWDIDTNKLELRLMAEGAFNYDPILYVPRY